MMPVTVLYYNHCTRNYEEIGRGRRGSKKNIVPISDTPFAKKRNKYSTLYAIVKYSIWSEDFFGTTYVEMLSISFN